MNFKSAYIRENFTEFLDAFLPDSTELSVDGIAFVRNQTSKITKITKLGECADLNLNLLEVLHNSNSDARVTLSREIFKVMRDNGWQNALVAFVPNDNPSVWRLSLVRMSYKLTDNGDLDFENSNPRRYSFLLGENQHTKTPEQYLAKRIHTLQELEDCFSVETLTKEFYTELFTWYQWAQSTEIDIHYPNNACDKNDDRDDLPTHIIRLITRLMFVWFIKQKKFIPNELFQENVLQNDILNNFDPISYTSGNYYNAILQNLFFASLNKKISERKFASGDREYGIKTLFRDNKKQTWFKIPHDAAIDLFKPVPFLNGGLFECLDQPIETCDENCKDPKIKIMYRDGFSRDDMRQKRAFIPNAVFFAPEHDVILSGDTKTKTVSGIINIFKKYNFTVEENTPNDIDVALDPELLGKVFENLLAAYNPETGESARKSSGSFYTPREIVNYMVEQSINAYLEQTVGENFKDKPDETKKALFNIKIIDPACGSGAFPMGILNNIFARLCAINPDFEQNPYETKLRLIENCIYGVDIQPIAVQISKLRFFISLICEQREQNLNSDENYGIEQLPNLETKFVAANTLVSIQKPRERSFGDKYIEEIQTKLTNVRHQHFHAKTWQEKKNCRDRDRDLRNELLRALESNGMMETPELHKQAVNIAAWDPYNQNDTANFFDPKWMFGISDGFDIVIGNPPYISLEKIKGELKNYYTDTKKWAVKTGSIDLYCLFYERGLTLLKPYGHLCYITSNKWLRSGYGVGLRQLFSTKYNAKLLLDLGGQIFQSATVDTNILLIQNMFKKGQKTYCWTKPKNIDPENMSDLIAQSGQYMQFTSEPWVILSPIEQSIKAKIEKYGTPLKDWDIDINYGIKTGCNEAFIIDAAKREELIAKDPKSAEIIRPILRGKDIRRYGYDWQKLYLINSHNGYGNISRIDIDNYPAIKDWLYNGGIAYNGKVYKGYETLAARADQGDTPYNLRSCAYMDDFSKPKIVYPCIMAKEPSFAYDDKLYFLPAPGNIITGKYILYLLAFLGSKTCYFALRNFYMGGGIGGELKTNRLLLLPVPLPTQTEIETKLNKMLKDPKNNIDMIESIVKKAYHLSDEESCFIGE